MAKECPLTKSQLVIRTLRVGLPIVYPSGFFPDLMAMQSSPVEKLQLKI